jgi:hypothetical protein
MGMQRFWNAGEPGQRTWVDRRERCEPPVQDGGHVACSSEVASAGGCQQVAEWVLPSFGREVEQMGPEGGPGGFSGESGEVLIGLVELCNGLGSEELFGCHVEAVGVALRPAHRRGARICCSVSVGVRGEMVSGRMMLWGSPSPTT